ncbi:hypothetical protein LF1_28010 [Rubripirellula obstinata]|uniref:Uncharacterized protein n=1 Tax=Rubripirellula obstinata TaxID=406547 RepID=A0A5B1CJ32_9BACT|nr:hypothetical protein [Rubripirellula obstinata]KAA1260262.1 hypothetical protein LF1_28010 [Rubripirellula obstinata]
MTRQITSLLALALFVSPTFADTGVEEAVSTETGKSCSAESCSMSSCSGGVCPIESAMAKLPKMTYLIGTESTCCSASAETLATKHDAPIQFVVDEETYDSKEDAMVALAESTETFVSTFASTHKCEASGTMTVAGMSTSCSVTAGKRAAVAKKAMDSVDMTYLVGTESCSCPMQAASMAKTSGEKQQFMIAGETTCCSIDARVRLAHAKYKAAVEALAKADAGTEADVQM